MKDCNWKGIFGMTDGFVRGLLLFLLVEYIMSVYIGQYDNALVTAILCAIVSVLLFVLFIKKLKYRVAAFYWIGQASYMVAVLLIFCNYLFLHLHIFPRRELGNGDGIIVMLAMAIYGFLSEVVRLIIWGSVKVFRHRRSDHSAS